jgi:hypothetical protein
VVARLAARAQSTSSQVGKHLANNLKRRSLYLKCRQACKGAFLPSHFCNKLADKLALKVALVSL